MPTFTIDLAQEDAASLLALAERRGVPPEALATQMVLRTLRQPKVRGRMQRPEGPDTRRAVKRAERQVELTRYLQQRHRPLDSRQDVIRLAKKYGVHIATLYRDLGVAASVLGWDPTPRAGKSKT